jgi:probable F420-dependent oxidoreductase
VAEIRVGAQIEPEQVGYAQLRETWLRAEELGADQLFTWDHFFPVWGDPTGPHLEGWTVLAAMAALTRRPAVGTLVTGNGYRNPQLLADMARTVDHVSGGRLILGIGAGWSERDYTEYGFRYGTTRERSEDLARALPLIKERLAKLNPPPVRGRIPILIGGGGARLTLRIVAEHADVWNYLGEPEVMAQRAQVLDDWCARIGRDPGEIVRSVLMLDPSLVERADEYVEAGITDLLVAVRAPEHDLEPLARLVEWRDARRAARRPEAARR